MGPLGTNHQLNAAIKTTYLTGWFFIFCMNQNKSSFPFNRLRYVPPMDLGPELLPPSRDSESAYHLSWLQPHDSKTRRPNESSLPSQCDGKTAIHAIQCWVYDGCQPPYTGCSEIGESDIESWFCLPTIRSIDNKPASGGLRLLCRQQQTSRTLPFKRGTLEVINKILGLTEAHAYLNRRGAGGCGHYLGIPNQPGLLKQTHLQLLIPITR